MNLPDGTRYFGSLDDAGLPDGEGFRLYPHQVLYKGHFERGERCGLGREETPYYVYEGRWRADKKVVAFHAV